MTFRIIAGAASLTAALLVFATPASAFDARKPADVLAVLQTNGASGELKTDDKGEPWIKGLVGKLIFEVNFLKCDKTKTACDLVVYQLGWDDDDLVNFEQINLWNRNAYLCPAYLNKDNHPYAWYALRPSVNDRREDVVAQQKEWLGCVADFDDFTSGPDTYFKTQ
ncbi:MAG: YbjN domain-containing protein [Pseudomonadota bacterium]